MRAARCWIRDAELDDAAELAALMCELGYETKRTEMETRLKLILSNPGYKTFVATMELQRWRKISLKEESGAFPWIHGLLEKMPTRFTSRSVTSETGGDL